jgi:hypothetical protein
MQNETVSYESAEGIEIRIKPTACLACETQFHPRRSTARYCSARCRVAHARSWSDSPATARQEPAGAIISVTGHHPSSPAAEGHSVTLTSPIKRESKPLPDGIVPDAKWPGMYRLCLPDGSLSVMVNLTRAKDALAQVPGGNARAAGLRRRAPGSFSADKTRGRATGASPIHARLR